jgi:DNA-binding NtrC family response regulator
VVDHDLSWAQLSCRILRSVGFECLWANTGEHALSLVTERGETPQLYLIDVRLPDLPGPTLAWLLFQRHGEVPVLFVSGYPSFDAALLRAARWDLLVKPFSADALVTAVRQMLSPPDETVRSVS